MHVVKKYVLIVHLLNNGNERMKTKSCESHFSEFITNAMNWCVGYFEFARSHHIPNKMNEL